MSIILILMAWFVDMPLWLSIVATVVMSIRLCAKFITAIASVANDDD